MKTSPLVALLALTAVACGGAETRNTAVLAPTPTSTAAPPASAVPSASATAPSDAPPATPPGGTAFCPPQGKIHFTGGDGSSTKNAVVIEGASGESDGVASEYACLAAVYGPRQKSGGWTLLGQSLLGDSGRSYDLMEVKLPSGKIIKVFFDITDYFGKF